MVGRNPSQSAADRPRPDSEVIFGVPFTALTFGEVVEEIVEGAKPGDGARLYFTTNVDNVVQLKKRGVIWASGDAWWEILLGMLFGVTAVWLTARAGRAFVGGTQMGFAYSCATVFAGVASGLAAARNWPQRACVVAALVSCAAAFGIQTVWPFAPWAAVVASFSGGLGMGALGTVRRTSAATSPHGIELMLGILLGVYIFQFALLLVGFKLLAICILAVLVFQSVRLRQAPYAVRTRLAENVSAVGEHR